MKWKSFKGNHSRRGTVSEGSDSSPSNAYTAAVATVVRAPPKNFRAVRQEWAAIRIQTAFRGFLVHGFLSSSMFSSSYLFGAEKMREETEKDT